MEDYDGRQVVGMDLHRRRSVLVRMTEDGQARDGQDHQQPAGAARADRPGRDVAEGGSGGDIRVVLGGGHPGRGGSRGAPRAPAGR